MKNSGMFRKSRRFGTRSFIPLLGALLFLTLSCAKEKAPEKPRVAPVKASVAAGKDVPVEINAIGQIEAFKTVGIKSQVSGPVLKVHFKEGQFVNRGDMLFTIDPRPFEAALMQAEATLARDVWQLQNARVQATRYEELFKKGFVSQADFDQFRTTAASLDATVKADSAAVDNAKLLLGYCYIRSPISGRTGGVFLDEGNVVKENADNPMVTIDQIEPIYSSFSVPEQYLHDIKTYMAKGRLKTSVTVPDSPIRGEGLLSFVDNAVDRTTGTIALKATFENKERKLWPGLFVNVTLRLSTIRGAVVVPSEAVLTGQNGQYVFVIKEDSTAETRPVTAGRAYGGETVIEKGISPGEKVVTDGQLQVIPGMKVEIKNTAPQAK